MRARDMQAGGRRGTTRHPEDAVVAARGPRSGVLSLQRSAGNRATASVLAPVPVQRNGTPPVSPTGTSEEYLRELPGRFPDLESGKHGMTDDFLPDLLRLQALIRDAARMTARLRPLEHQLRSEAGPAATAPVKGRVTRLLEAKEGEHGFSTIGLLPVGILSTQTFLELPLLGYVFKDPGAGVEHGEYTHRLQWYAVMVDFERHTKRWDHTPYELYTKIGERDMRATIEAEKNKTGKPNSLFADLMDQAGEAPEQGFRHPDSMTKALVDQAATSGMPGSLPLLGEEVKRRFGKRKEAQDFYAGQWQTSSPEERQAIAARYGIALTRQVPGIMPGTVATLTKSPQLVGADLSMFEYKLKKTAKGGGYEPYFPSRPGEELLVRSGSDRTSRVEAVLRRLEMRSRFGMSLSAEEKDVLDDATQTRSALHPDDWASHVERRLRRLPERSSGHMP